MYIIRHSTKKGGSGMFPVSTITQVQKEIERLFKNKLCASAEKENIIIGEVYKSDGNWQWYLDTEA